MEDLGVSSAKVLKCISLLYTGLMGEQGQRCSPPDGGEQRESQHRDERMRRRILSHIAPAFTRWLGDVSVFRSLSSTNTHLLYSPYPPKNKYSVCVALQQTRGRGRFGRVWVSYEGGLYLSVSCVLRDQKTPIAMWNIRVANIILVYLKQILGLKVIFKKPNDLYLNGAKLAGVLSECKGDLLICGVGLNIFAMEKSSQEEIPNRVITLSEVVPNLEAFSYERIAAGVLESVMQGIP